MNETYPAMEGPCCPMPLNPKDHITIGHGSGGKLTQELIYGVFQPRLGNAWLNSGNDAAVVEVFRQRAKAERLVVSTDAHIVSPLFFPGGDIGRLSVCGTVNDVAMLGARPQFLTATFIIEEGLEVEKLARIVDSMAQACQEAGVEIIAADTKVTEKGKSDGLFISTTGIGFTPKTRKFSGNLAKAGDAVLVTGSLGNHGIAIAQARGNLGFQSEVQSDTNPLNHLIEALCTTFSNVHVLRDPTRGGLATTLAEIANQSQVTIQLEEQSIPVDLPVRMACELLGLDPLYLANEGKAIVILPEADVPHALELLRSQKYGEGSVQIGKVVEQSGSRVFIKTAFGTTRILEMLAGEMLPRIC